MTLGTTPEQDNALFWLAEQGGVCGVEKMPEKEFDLLNSILELQNGKSKDFHVLEVSDSADYRFTLFGWQTLYHNRRPEWEKVQLGASYTLPERGEVVLVVTEFHVIPFTAYRMQTIGEGNRPRQNVWIRNGSVLAISTGDRWLPLPPNPFLQ